MWFFKWTGKQNNNDIELAFIRAAFVRFWSRLTVQDHMVLDHNRTLWSWTINNLEEYFKLNMLQDHISKAYCSRNNAHFRLQLAHFLGSILINSTTGSVGISCLSVQLISNPLRISAPTVQDLPQVFHWGGLIQVDYTSPHEIYTPNSCVRQTMNATDLANKPFIIIITRI